ncbi:SusC/RagA family TonB-linked outer membrane protein [Hymenobacter sedentarius]|uniref:SusC/RagA family TonB-linked outer membrane protein n=1 Tax=Hymenobacter sedentarius TaxID=1411621 RepID=A0A0U4BZ12_9BACT|nr:TonB-dependent receptor [Hymenobacter sedentarius]ALW85473.1 SusC/RagA family TonB-linked outer membrane protein [Hymenobacter sedentarius]
MKFNLLTHLKLFSLLALCLFAMPAWAQQAISGRVLSSDGGGLPGATILERGTTNGTSSGADGSFSLTVKPNATLVISSVGYTSQNVAVGNQSTITVTLATSATELSEAVVVGYGTQQKADLTGSVASLTNKDIANAPVQTFEQAIQGKAAGVVIENSSGKLGQAIKVRVRGTSSVSGDTQPLYVIDNIPVQSDNFSSTSAPTNPLADINPNDIESITILKDAAASAIYGSRASNGVVLITTKHGKAGDTRFNLGYQVGTSQATHIREFLNAKEYVALMTEARKNAGSSDATIATRLQGYAAGVPVDANYNVDTNWADQVLRKAAFNQYDLSASGGSEKTKFFLSGQYSGQEGIVLGNKLSRIASRLNVDHKASNRLTLGVNVALSRTNNSRLPNDNLFSNPLQIVALAPITPVIDPRTGLTSGALDLTTGKPNTSFPFYYNPLLGLQNNAATYTAIGYRALGNVYGQFEILPGLTFRSELGADLLNQDEDQYSARVTVVGNSSAGNGYAFSAHTTSGRYITNNFFSYRKVLAEQHTLEATLGTAYEQRNVNYTSTTGSQFASDAYRTIVNAATFNNGVSSGTSNSLLSYFARLNYSFAGKYLLGLSARADGSSRFGANHRYGFFPAASAGWVVTEESFLKDQKVLSFLKPRVSLGVTGNQAFTDFASLGLYAGSAGYVGIPGQRPLQIANPDLKWESTRQADAGLEFGFFDNRISGEVDVYQKLTTDLALNAPLPATTGYTSQFQNVGKLENKGIEFALTTRNLTGAFTWTTTANASRNYNKVTNLKGLPISGSYLSRAQEGYPIGTFFGPEYAGVDPANGDALYYKNKPAGDPSSAASIDHSAGTTNNINLAQAVPLGSPNATWTGGLTNTFTFKGIDLTATFIGVSGNKIFDAAGQFYSVGFNNGPDNQTRDQLNRWQKPGDITNVPKAIYNGGNGIGNSSRFVYDGSYVRLRTLTLGYNLPGTLVKKGYLQSARVYVQGQNLLTFTKYPGSDPEVNTDYLGTTTTAGNINQGIDFYSTPQPRTLTLGVNIGF